ncbi:response regulator [Sulfurospirillum diekertiae]|uniref:Two-component sensor histidine kinase n=1 Tax=Sulfurospirillum diekertiae TaxID=1854492 RepID=A0A290HCW8_9BACT|nr:hybrid sensor histidine kinase/response regulator [Sulfurospirillum diekertiae]ATB69297.1 putative two-component sensor histidine kinase [Sulfurospirillum diekertiae]QIR79560.1 response regulator [Sulfurospirillum diekertiae]
MENQIDQLIAWSKELKILYVEDDLALREEVCLFLSDIFTQVDLASNGEEGLQKLSLTHYDFVITDIKMPLMNGIEMIENIKRLYPSLPILVTSAHNESDHLIKLINLNVDNFITKPLQSEQIFRVLHSIVKHIHDEQELKHYKNELEITNQKLKKIAHIQSQSIDLKDSLLRAYQEALDKATIVSLTDKNGIITDVNENFCKATGYSKEEIIGQKYDVLYHPSMSKEIYKDIWSCLLAKKTWQGLIINQTRALTPLYNYKTIVPILDAKGEFIKFISIAQDLTELYKHNEETTKENIERAINVKENDLLKQIPFASALLLDDLHFENHNTRFEEIVNNHVDETLLGKLTTHTLHLSELVNFEEMDYFNSIEAIKNNWPYDGDITFKGVIRSIGHLLEVLVKISQYEPNRYIICIVKQEDFELCCQVQER